MLLSKIEIKIEENKKHGKLTDQEIDDLSDTLESFEFEALIFCEKNINLCC